MSRKSLLALSLVGAVVLFLTGSASADRYQLGAGRAGPLPEPEPEPNRHTMTIFNGSHVVQQNFVEKNGSWRNSGEFKNYDVFFRDCPRSPWRCSGTYYSARRGGSRLLPEGQRQPGLGPGTLCVSQRSSRRQHKGEPEKAAPRPAHTSSTLTTQSSPKFCHSGRHQSGPGEFSSRRGNFLSACCVQRATVRGSVNRGRPDIAEPPTRQNVACGGEPAACDA